MKKQLWLAITTFPILIILLSGCAGLGFEEEKVAKEPINRAEWPTLVPPTPVASPTPFPKIELPPTPRPAVESEQPVSVSPTTEPTVTAAASMSSLIGTITAQAGPLAGLAPVAVGFILNDNTPIRSGPGGSYSAAGTGVSAEMAAVLGQNPGGDWLYIITITAQQGWVPSDSMRVTGSLAEAPVLPPNPIEAALAQAISAAGGTSDTAPSTVPAQPEVAIAELKAVATAKVTSAALNLRQRPGADYPRLATLPQGQEVELLALNQDKQWALVVTPEQKFGWVSVKFLEVDGSLADAPQLRTLPPAPGGGESPDQPAPLAMLSNSTAATATAGGAAAVIPVSAQNPALTIPAQTLAPVTPGKINIKTDLRRGPGQAFGAVDTLMVDEPVTILAVDQSGDWAVVQATRSRLGWLPLSSVELAGAVTGAAQAVTAWVTSDGIEVKQGPGIYHPAAGKLARNDLVAVLALNPGRNWTLIETTAGGRGWTPVRFLTNYSVPLDNLPELESTPPAAAAEVAPPEPAVALVDKGPGQLVIQRSSGGDILALNPDGTGLRQLTSGIDPALSPDRQTVAFTRWQGEIGSLWLINLDGSNERKILDFTKQAKGPAWSPDSSQLIINYQQGGRLDEKQICENISDGNMPGLPRNARNIKVGIEQNSDGEFEPHLCWVVPPDRHWNLRLVKLADGSFEDLDGGTYAFRPTWDPANPWRVVSAGGRGLVEVDVTRKYQQAITDQTGDGSPVFSPDGRYLAVTVGHPGGGQGYDIYRLNADGSGRVRLTQTPLWETVQPDAQKPWNNVAPAWSPDATQIAFLTDRAGRWEIWVMNADGSNQRPFFSDEINDQLDLTYNFVDERMISWQ